MKKTTREYIVNTTMLLMLSVLYHFWQPYPKSILLRAASGDGVSNLVTNIIFFIIQTLVLVAIARQTAAKKLTWEKRIAAYVLLIAVQLLMDVVILQIAKLPFEYQHSLYDLCVLFTWVLNALALNYLICGVELKLLKTVKKTRILALAVAGLMALAIIMNLFDNLSLARLTEKYRTESNTFLSLRTNMVFKWELRNGLLNVCISAIMLAVLTMYLKQQPTKEFKAKKYEPTYGRTAFSLFLNIFFIIAAMEFVAVFKMAAIHQSCMLPIPYAGFSGYSRDGFAYDEQPFVLTRVTEGNIMDDWDCVYSTTRYVIKIADKRVGAFTITGDDICSSNDNQDYFGKTLHLEDYSKFLCKGRHLVWLEDTAEKPRHMSINRLSTVKETPALTEVCHILTEYGLWSTFEGASKYLLKYDPVFIQPYIERYAAGDFTAEELEKNTTIRSECIQSVAKSLLGGETN